MKIIKALPEDHSLLTEITKKAKSYWNYSAAQIELWNDQLTVTENYLEKHETYKLMVNEEVIGYYSFNNLNNNEAKLDNMSVLPSYIGKGFGKALIQDALTRLKQQGFKKVILDSEPYAEKFYLKMGFTVIGQLESSVKDRFLPVMEKDV